MTVGIDTWVTIVEADAYMLGKFDASAWTSLPNATKEQALITAFRWIRSVYDISASSTLQKIKDAQCECAWYVYSHWTQHEKRSALISQGVEDFTVSKFSETLGKTELPEFVKDLLKDFTVGEYFPVLTREIE